MQAIGFRSDAWTSQPMRAASKGIEPPPEKVLGELRPMAEAGNAKLIDQLRYRMRVRAEMAVHLRPDAGEQISFVAFLRPQAESQAK